jgi:hypothetical protein
MKCVEAAAAESNSNTSSARRTSVSAGTAVAASCFAPYHPTGPASHLGPTRQRRPRRAQPATSLRGLVGGLLDSRFLVGEQSRESLVPEPCVFKPSDSLRHPFLCRPRRAFGLSALVSCMVLAFSCGSCPVSAHACTAHLTACLPVSKEGPTGRRRAGRVANGLAWLALPNGTPTNIR